MRKLLAALACTLGILGVIPAGAAHADIIQSYGHHDTYWNISGNISCSTCSDRAFRVGVELRTLGSGGSPSNYDMNVCVQPLFTQVIVRVSINDESIFRDGTTFVGGSSPNVVGGNTGTTCADMDPNVGVCGPSRSSSFLADGNIGVRRTDNVLITRDAFSSNATMPCD